MKLMSLFAFVLLVGTIWGQDLILKQSSGKFGYQDASGKWVIEPQYDDAWDFSDGLALVKKKGKWGYINTQNQTIIPFELDKGSLHRYGFAKIMKGGKYGLINTKEFVLQPLYDLIQFEENYRNELKWIRITKNNLQGLYDPITQKVEQPKYDKIKDFYGYEGMYEVSKNGKLGLWCEGKEIVPVKYSNLSTENLIIHDGWSQVLHQEMNEFGEPVYVDYKKRKFITASLGGKKEYFAKSGESKGVSGELLPQTNGNVWVRDPKKSGSYFVYDYDLKLLTPQSVIQYKEVETKSGKYIILSSGDKIGLWEPQQKKWMLKPVYRSIEYISGLDAFLTSFSPTEYDLYASDLKTKLEDVKSYIPTWEENKNNYFVLLEKGKKYVIKIVSGTSIRDYKKISAPFDSGSLIYDPYGDIVLNAILLERMGKNFYFNLLKESEYGPVESVSDIVFWDQGQSLLLTQIILKSSEYIYLDEAYNEVFSKGKDVKIVKVSAGNQEFNFFVFQSMVEPGYFIQTLGSEPINLNMDSYKDQRILDISKDIEDEIYGDPYWRKEPDFLLVLDGSKNGNPSSALLHCEELRISGAEEIILNEFLVNFRKNHLWGAYIPDNHLVVEPNYKGNLSKEGSFSFALERPILISEKSLIDPIKNKVLAPWDYEPEIKKYGKFYHVMSYNYIETDEEERTEEIKLTQGNYTEIIALNEVDDEILNYADHFEHIYMVKKDGKWGIIDLFEEEIVPIIYDRIDIDYGLLNLYGYETGPMLLYKGKETTVYDIRTKKQLLPFGVRSYEADEEYMSFKSPLIYHQNKKWGYVLYNYKTGEIKDSGPQFDDFQFLDESYSLLFQKEGEIEIHLEGGSVIHFEGDELIKDLYDAFWIRKGNKHQIIDFKKNVLLEFDTKPDAIEGDSYAVVVTNGKLGTYYEVEEKKLVPKKTEQEMMFMVYSDYYLMYKKDDEWYALKSNLKDELKIGKSQPERIFELEGKPILFYRKKGITLIDHQTGKSYSNKKGKAAYPKTIQEQMLIYVSGANVYLDKDFNEIEIKTGK
ncbi:MAG: WG repeat-containing protein [Crocinitomicaceae bacterium]|nr:WG repeat-containing protein [Crocinitomicaceae bacterium]